MARSFSNENIPLAMKINGKNLRNLAKKNCFYNNDRIKKKHERKQMIHWRIYRGSARRRSVEEKHERRGCG